MADAPEILYRFSAPLLDGTVVGFDSFRGRVLLIVNTASQCGFTPQYAGLESLHREFQDRGFAVLAFPSNQFGHQEPGTGEEIGAFCSKNYGVSFPVFAKIEVNGANAHPLYQFLKRQQPGMLGPIDRGRIKWNFTKFLADRRGSIVARFAPATEPKTLAPAIERLLSAK
jgi:glutathione peroxidase